MFMNTGTIPSSKQNQVGMLKPITVNQLSIILRKQQPSLGHLSIISSQLNQRSRKLRFSF